MENVKPYAVAVYELSPEYLESGKTNDRRAVRSLKHGIQNNWPGYPSGVRLIEPPKWSNNGYIV